ncbi:MAG: hypothetical protein V2A77_10425 [Pseudomonadota bacterium]
MSGSILNKRVLPQGVFMSELNPRPIFDGFRAAGMNSREAAKATLFRLGWSTARIGRNCDCSRRLVHNLFSGRAHQGEKSDRVRELASEKLGRPILELFGDPTS